MRMTDGRRAQTFFLCGMACMCGLAGISRNAWPADGRENWSPRHNVEIIVPASPGGGFDLAARTVQTIVQKRRIISAPVVVVNKPGGGGLISWTYLNEHDGDGGELCVSTPNILTNYITGKSHFRYSVFTPIAQLYTEYPVFIVRAGSPLRTGRGLVDALKRNVTSLSISVGSGIGNVNHLALVLVAKAAGVDGRALRTVVFKGSSEALAALLGGHIDVSITGVSAALPSVRAGKVRILGVSAPHRLGGPLAAVPTWKEQGADVVVGNWRGIIGAPGMSAAQVSYWNRMFGKLVKTPDWRKTAGRYFWTTDYMNSAASRRFLAQQYAMLGGLLEDIGLAQAK